MTLKTHLSGPGVRNVFRALSHRNFRLFFSGQCISLIGTWIQQVAMSWLIYRLSHSTFLLGMVGFITQTPGFFLAPFAGILADRMNRHYLIIATQTLAMIQAFILAYLSLTGTIQVWHVLVLSVFYGFVTGVDIPIRQSFVVDLLEDPQDLSNAIALNSTIFNGARLIGPTIAGLTIAVAGEGICFLINGISYVAVLLALLAMTFIPRERPLNTQPILQGIREGFSYAYHHGPIRAILMLVCLISLTGLPYIVLMPVFAKDILHGGPETMGFLLGASGIGALIGAIYLASRKSVLGLGRWIVIAVLIFGVSLIAFAWSRLLWLSLLIMPFVGFGMMVHLASSNILLQTLVQENMRGRVMSLYTMGFLGMMPIGSLLIGVVGTHIGVAHTLMIGGMCCVIGAFLFGIRLESLRNEVRPIYLEKGIITDHH